MTTKQYLYNRITGQKYPLNGLIMSNRHVDAISLDQVMTPNEEQLPRAVNLTPYMSDVEHQLNTNSCVANSIVGKRPPDRSRTLVFDLMIDLILGAYEYLMRRSDNDKREMSRLFIYYYARKIDPSRALVIRDTGCEIGFAIEAIKRFGTCTEDRWKFVFENRNAQPTPDCLEEAKQHKATDAVQVPINLTALRACLARGFPIVIGALLYQSFAKAETNGGRVDTPQPGERPLQGAERHAMLLAGYDDEQQYFIVRNSWGPKWGNKGYCAMPYNYIGNDKLCVIAYVIRKVDDFDFGDQHWTDSDKIELFGVPSDLGGSEDGGEENCEVIDADEDEDMAGAGEGGEEAGAGDDGNTQEESQGGEEQNEEE